MFKKKYIWSIRNTPCNKAIMVFPYRFMTLHPYYSFPDSTFFAFHFCLLLLVCMVVSPSVHRLLYVSETLRTYSFTNVIMCYINHIILTKLLLPMFGSFWCNLGPALLGVTIIVRTDIHTRASCQDKHRTHSSTHLLLSRSQHCQQCLVIRRLLHNRWDKKAKREFRLIIIICSRRRFTNVLVFQIHIFNIPSFALLSLWCIWCSILL